MRGTVAFPGLQPSEYRITPARAGNSVIFAGGAKADRDHPRVCGEQISATLPSMVRKGSPPRVRGTANALSGWPDQSRITPACAGNRCRMIPALAMRRDHPRVCGEQIKGSRPGRGPPGSPPRVRGTVQGHIQHHDENRITPACAGNRPLLPPAPQVAQDHPRVCGEQASGGMYSSITLGSPPRVRGTGPRRSRALSGRITPACAGNRWPGFQSWTY